MSTEWRTEFYGTLVPERDAAGRLRRLAEHEVPVERDDGGQALVAEFSGGGDGGLFVRVQSWDESKRHEEMHQLMGRRVRITIEVLDR
jgi:hypothetical protein